MISGVFKPSNNVYSLKGIYNTQADFPKVGKNKLVLLWGLEGILITTNSLICFSIENPDLIPVVVAPPRNVVSYLVNSCFISNDEIYLFAICKREP